MVGVGLELSKGMVRVELGLGLKLTLRAPTRICSLESRGGANLHTLVTDQLSGVIET